MNDKMIISVISKTYFIILSFLIFIFLTSTLLFILLQNGLHIKELSISNIQIKQLYLKWDEKIDVSIKEIDIVSQEKDSKAVDYKLISNYLNKLKYSTDWFHSIVIEKISLKEFHISFEYKQNAKGFIVVKSPSLYASSSIQYDQDILNLTIEKFYDKLRKISMNGDIYLNLTTQQGFAHINSTINNDANLSLYSVFDSNNMDFIINSKNNINDFKYLVQLASLPKEIKFWTQDAIVLESIEIQSLRGKIDFHNIKDVHKNIYVKARANKLIYTYNTQLDGIHTEYTDLEFKEGVLFIRPHNSFSYKNSLGESWLNIDFTSKEELLTLHLLFDGQLNKDMLEVLNAYKIKLPFLQKKGFVSTNLNLVVNLMSIDVDAKGSFYIKEANFDYLGLNIDIFDTFILLNNYDVKIDKMRASYKGIAKADVKVTFDAKTSQGKIDFDFNYISLKGLQLDSTKSNLQASYIISPKQDQVNIANSLWKFKDKKLTVDALQIPFDLEKLNLSIPTTFLEIPGTTSAFLSGKVNLKNQQIRLFLDVLSLSYDGISFSQSNTPFLINYNKQLSIVSPEKLFFNISGTEYMLDKPKIVMKDNKLTLKNTKLKIGQYATTKIYAKHNTQTEKTHVSLSDFTIKNYQQDKTLYKKKKILLAIEDKNDSITINSQELDTTLVSTSRGWRVYINSLAQIATDSEPLKELHLNKGNLTLYKNKDDKYAQFSANISYPYKILIKDNKPTKLYNIEGKLKNEVVYFTVNKNSSVTISDKIKIKTRNTGINIEEVIRLTQSFSNSKEKNSLDIRFKAIDSYLYISDTRKVISELINVQYINNILTAQLKDKKGKAGLRFEGKEFHLYGKNFNDEFMQELFYLSKFKGGTLDFSMDGTTDEYDGIFYISNSTIIDYKILNNILAFINTVPSLVTFSLPGYNKNGLHAKEAYMSFKAKDNTFNLSDIYLESKELSIVGKGKANIKDDTVNIRLNLKTDLGSDASKIPLVGYILFDDESVSTTLKINGKLSNPNIESLIARDIVVAPLNIIKRTLTLPYNLLKNLQTESNTTK